MTTASKEIDTSGNKGDCPREEFQTPAPIPVVGRKHADKSGSTDGEEKGRPLMPPPATSLTTRKSTNDDSKNAHVGAALAGAKESGAILPPHPRRKEEAGAGQDGGSGYVPPSWGLTTLPTSLGLSLTVLKGGAEVGSISLDNQAYFLLGRQQGVVDIILEHPSISRKHAILQHGDKGSLFLLDNGSTHGSRVNKEKIPPKEFHRLHVGDVIKFGESSRLYLLEGPEELRPAEYESENLRNLRLEAGRKQLAAKLVKIKAGGAGGEGDSGEYGINWGFDEDAVDEDEENDGAADDEDGASGEVELPDYLKTEAQKRRRHDTRTGLTEDSIHERDAKLFEKLQVKLTKVEHLLTENERIAVKEGAQGGLTEGQQAQMARNDKAIAAIRLQIEELEDTIRSKNKAREHSKGGDGGKDGVKSGEREDVEEDDYYDRTAPLGSASSRRTPGGALSKKAEVRARRFDRKDRNAKNLAVVPRVDVGSSSAISREGGGGAFSSGEDAQSLEVLKQRAETVVRDLERAQVGLAELDAEETEEEEEGGADPLDQFMASNRRNERQQAMTRLSAQRDSLIAEKERLGVMIEAATPSMPTLKPVATASLNESTGSIVPEKSPPLRERVEPMLASGEVKGEELVTHNGSASTFGGSDDGSRSEGGNNDYPSEQSCKSSPALSSTTLQASVCRSPVSDKTAVDGDEQNILRDSEGDGAGLEQSSGGKKRRRTPVEGAMLPPPPPVKRSERAGNENAAMKEEGDFRQQSDGATARRTVKGPSAMPPPSVKPPRGSAGGNVRREMPAEDVKEHGGKRVDSGVADASNVEEKVVLEGGDADWVPPKGQVGDGRTALNAKFGY